jgi:hypothetical protein
VLWVGEIPIPKTKVVYLGNTLACAGKEGFLAFDVYEGVPHVVNELSGYWFIVFRVLCGDVVTGEHADGVPLCGTLNVSR